MGSVKDFEQKIKALMFELGSTARMRTYADEAAKLVKLRTRLGYGVAQPEAERTPLKKLSPWYKKIRQRLASRGELSSQTSVGKSNLTQTGQMLDSIKTTYSTQGLAIYRPTGIRKDGLKNVEVAGSVSRNGRPFLELSKIEVKRVSVLIEEELRKLIKRLLT